MPMVDEINPARVRYIKLGEAGHWEEECLEKRIIRFGFEAASAKRFPLCLQGRWDELRETFIAEGKTPGTATNFTNQAREYFTDNGSTLWITFMGPRLYWGFLEPTPPERHPDGGGVCRTVSGGWRCTDLKEDGELTKDLLSGNLTKLAAFRGTSCQLDTELADYVVRRVNGKRLPEVERAIAYREKIKLSVVEMMRLLDPGDFETLVDLVFSASGWRRLGKVGGLQETLDIHMKLPSTGQRAFVQVKSKTSSAELAEYVRKRRDYYGDHRMFYVHHSGEASTDDELVTVVGPEKLAELVFDAGLVNWLIDKASWAGAGRGPAG